MFQLGFVDLFCRDTQPADIRQAPSPNEGLVAYGASHGRSRVQRREVGHQLARRRDAALDECRGHKPAADRFMKAVERATANKSLHSGPRRRGNDKAGYRRSLRDTTERERLGQCREFETATVLLANAPSATATAQAVDLAG